MDWTVTEVRTETGDLIVELSTEGVEVSPGVKWGNSTTVKIPKQFIPEIADLLAPHIPAYGMSPENE